MKVPERLKGVKFSIFIPGELRDRLDSYVERTNKELDESHPQLDLEVSRNQVVCKAIEEYLGRQG